MIPFGLFLLVLKNVLFLVVGLKDDFCPGDNMLPNSLLIYDFRNAEMQKGGAETWGVQLCDDDHNNFGQTMLDDVIVKS